MDAKDPHRVCRRMTEQLMPKVAAADRAIRDMRRQLARLEKAGLARATPHWRAGKYLYLIHPTQPDRSRRREYIGASPDRIKEAEGRISRAKKHCELSDHLRVLERSVAAAAEHIAAAARALDTAVAKHQ